MDQYWLTPVRGEGGSGNSEILEHLLEKSMFGFGEHTPCRKRMMIGDWICFYLAGAGVVAHACLRTIPARKSNSEEGILKTYPWTCELERVSTYFSTPRRLDREIRSHLSTLGKKRRPMSWGWFVQSPRQLTKEEFSALTSIPPERLS